MTAPSAAPITKAQMDQLRRDVELEDLSDGRWMETAYLALDAAARKMADALALMLAEIRSLNPSEEHGYGPPERRIPTQHRLDTIRQARAALPPDWRE